MCKNQGYAFEVYPLIIKNGMKNMNIILFIAIFISGTVFGSFFSLAVYRLPRKEDITHQRSHCTTCNHKLNFWDLIPVFSYIFLGGKCRYCGEKIRCRYVLLEVFSGLTFVLIALMKNISIYSSIYEFVNLFFVYLFVCSLFIIGGIDKERYEIHGGTLIYGIAVSLLYGLYNSFFGITMKYNMIGFMLIPLFLLVINLVLYKLIGKEKLPFGFGDIEYISMIGLFMGFGMQIISIALAVVIGSVLTFIKKYKQIPFGYFLSISTVIIIIFARYLLPVAELINNNIG